MNKSIKYYSFQHRVSHKGKWLKPNTMKKIPISKRDEWSGSSWDYFHFRLENDIKDEPYHTWCQINSHGYFTLKKAKRALKQVQKYDIAGEYNYTNSYKQWHQDVRHEFRIVEVIYTPDIVKVVEI